PVLSSCEQEWLRPRFVAEKDKDGDDDERELLTKNLLLKFDAVCRGLTAAVGRKNSTTASFERMKSARAGGAAPSEEGEDDVDHDLLELNPNISISQLLGLHRFLNATVTNREQFSSQHLECPMTRNSFEDLDFDVCTLLGEQTFTCAASRVLAEMERTSGWEDGSA
ncbi:unnamed protein product, partial [Amoebophrya sp. A120]